MDGNTVLYGADQAGNLVKIGDVQADSRAKQEELVRIYFGETSQNTEDGTEADMCAWALKEYHDWLVKEGFITCGSFIMKKS